MPSSSYLEKYIDVPLQDKEEGKPCKQRYFSVKSIDFSAAAYSSTILGTKKQGIKRQEI